MLLRLKKLLADWALPAWFLICAGQLAILDENHDIAGLVEFSFIKPDARALRLDVPRKHGFDGYTATTAQIRIGGLFCCRRPLNACCC